jgi:hypothetical protein
MSDPDTKTSSHTVIVVFDIPRVWRNFLCLYGGDVGLIVQSENTTSNMDASDCVLRARDVGGHDTAINTCRLLTI